MRVRLGMGLAYDEFAVFDDADATLVLSHRWVLLNASGWKYAITRIDGRMLSMHRLLMLPADRLVVDHMDGDGLNNQRANLRVCSMAENLRNRRKSSNSKWPYKGIEFHGGKWRVRITHAGRRQTIGPFDTAEQAAAAYDAAAKKLHGVFAYLNFPEKLDVAA